MLVRTYTLLSLALSRSLSIWLVLGTMREFVEKKVYVTAVFMDTDGSIVGSYRKRKPTMEGAVSLLGTTLADTPISTSPSPQKNKQHAAGDKVGVFDTKFGRIGVMICFDIENEDILHETLALDPVIMLNPTWIPSPPIMKGPRVSFILGIAISSPPPLSYTGPP